MLFRIKPDDVEIGMFVHGFEGKWIDHPFWRSRFLVETPEQVSRIRNSRIERLIIDNSRSPNPARATLPGFGSKGAARPAPTASRITCRVRRRTKLRSGYASESRRAAAIIGRGREVIFDMFEAARLGRAIETAPLIPLAEAIGASIARDSQALINLVRIKKKDEYTYLHSVAVCALMMNFARQLELSQREVRDLGIAGLLHDVGKISIADEILRKAGALDGPERQAVQGHARAGYRLLSQAPDVPEAALEVCLRHHERVDGSGYPDGLSGDALSLYARMGAICDVYDAVTSERPYKDAWMPCEALTAMHGWSGHFDQRLLDRFSDSLGIYPVGTLVRLSNGLLGVVAGSDEAARERMIVRAFFDCDILDEIDPVDLAIAPSAEDPRILGRDSPRFWRFDDWDAMRHRILAAKRPEAERNRGAD